MDSGVCTHSPFLADQLNLSVDFAVGIAVISGRRVMRERRPSDEFMLIILTCWGFNLGDFA